MLHFVLQSSTHTVGESVGETNFQARPTQAPKTQTGWVHELNGHASHEPWFSRLHIILTLFFIKFALLFCCSILVLLVLTHKVIHITFRFRELHLIHTFAGVPMEESLAAEHRCEVFRNPFEHFLDRCGVSCEGDSHLQALGW